MVPYVQLIRGFRARSGRIWADQDGRVSVAGLRESLVWGFSSPGQPQGPAMTIEGHAHAEPSGWRLIAASLPLTAVTRA
jgi:hypothetical protein